jgi:hypothetical protein
VTARARTAGLVVGLTALGLGCGRNIEGDVKRAFAAQRSCPVDRITVTMRPELKQSVLEARRRRPPAAIPESVKPHPQLYAKVKEAKERERALFEEGTKRPVDRTPPPEVAADPARLALWRAERAAEQARLDRSDREHPVAEVAGCGERGLYVCTLVGRRYWCSPAPDGR